MKRNRNYVGIDCFRIIAALLVIAIHTSPLKSFSETGDYILTRALGRIAVPFFFISSGFFLISRYTYDNEKLKAFLKKTTVIYIAAIIIYVPVNIYNGYFAADKLLPGIIKDIAIDGTMYHLWYLPASMAGAVIAWFLVKRQGFRKAFITAAVLYIIGLFGDSYYGFIEGIPVIQGFYGLIFQVTDYTRNGVFFAPVFFILGGITADMNCELPLVKSMYGFAAMFIMLHVEALLLRHLGVQRHDSMYICLIPAVFFMFNILLHWKSSDKSGMYTRDLIFKDSRILSRISLLIYIVHPLMIIGIRLFAKLTGLYGLLVENSVIHYVAVTLASAALATTVVIILANVKL